MGHANDLASSSFWMAIGITLIAVFLGLRQWYEWRAREEDLSALDRKHFFRQDLRRGLGVAVMLCLALGIWLGARVEPTIAQRANLDFVRIWLGVIALILVLLTLAMVDWWATRVYARRLRRNIARERVEILRQAFRGGRASSHHDPAAEADDDDQPPGS